MFRCGGVFPHSQTWSQEQWTEPNSIKTYESMSGDIASQAFKQLLVTFTDQGSKFWANLPFEAKRLDKGVKS